MPLTTTGFIPLTGEQCLSIIQDSFKSVFGDNVNLEPSSPNGLFIQNQANWLVRNQGDLALLYNRLYDPNVATGIWLDTICSFLGIYRKPPQPSRVVCQCSGSSGTIIPAGSQVISTLGFKFESQENATIGALGAVDVEFFSVDLGSIPVNNNTVNSIVTSVSGWDSVNNNESGTLGTDLQSDYSLANDRTQLLNKQGSGSIGSIYAGVYETNGVTDIKVIENNTRLDKVVDGVSLEPYSVMVSVIGGSDNDIGGAIYEKCMPGTPLQGNTSGVYVAGLISGGTSNFNYTIQRPVIVPSEIKITVKGIAASKIDEVKEAIYKNWIGESGITGIGRVRLGEIVNMTRFAPTLLLIGVYQTQEIELAIKSDGVFKPQISVPVDQILTLDILDIEVIIV